MKCLMRDEVKMVGNTIARNVCIYSFLSLLASC